jgi:hypothetical protein
VIAILGGAGSGLVWGWYGGGVGVPRRAGSVPALVAAGAALIGQARLIGGEGAAAAFVAALVVGLVLRLAWLSWLRWRVRSTQKGGA